MSPLKISEEEISRYTTSKVYTRGVELYQQNAVRNLTLLGDRITAQVKGTYQPYYTVTVGLEEGEVAWAECNCDYEFEGWCKHIVAALLTCVHQPERIEVLEPVLPTIENLEHEDARALLSELARQDPAVAERIDALMAQRTARRQLAPHHPPPVRVSDFAPNYVSRSVEILKESGELIQQLIEQGQYETAFQLIEKGMRPLAAELSQIPAYEYEVDERDEQTWAYSILLTELILSVSSPPAALRVRIVARVASWDDAVSEAGIEYFDLCAFAFTRYWSVDAGVFEEGDDAAWDDDFDFGEDEDFDDSDWFKEEEVEVYPFTQAYERDLADITLHILEYRGQTRQYLELARANRFFDRYVIMLALQGEQERAAQEAYEHLNTCAEWYGVIRAFYQLGAVDTAFEMAQHALEIPMVRVPFFGFVGEPPSRLKIAEWLLEHAQQHGRNDLALRAAQAALQEDPNPTRYRQLEQLAGSQWSAIRPQVLKQLEQQQALHIGVFEIFMQEEMYPQALNALTRGYLFNPDNARRLAKHLPEKVRNLCIKEADKIIQKNRSDKYPLAAEWLQVVKETYLAQGRESEWQAYIHQLIEENRRKRSLVPLLEQIQ